MSKENKYPNDYNLCACGKYKTIKSNQCIKCTNNAQIQYLTIKDAMVSARHGQSAKFNIIRGRARSMYKHIKNCQHCGYSKHVEVCHIKPIHAFPEDTLISIVNAPNNILILCRNCHWEFDHDQKPKKEKYKKPRPRKVEWPSKENLESLLNTKTITSIGLDYGVSEAAVRKWIKKYNIVRPQKEK